MIKRFLAISFLLLMGYMQAATATSPTECTRAKKKAILEIGAYMDNMADDIRNNDTKWGVVRTVLHDNLTNNLVTCRFIGDIVFDYVNMLASAKSGEFTSLNKGELRFQTFVETLYSKLNPNSKTKSISESSAKATKSIMHEFWSYIGTVDDGSLGNSKEHVELTIDIYDNLKNKSKSSTKVITAEILQRVAGLSSKRDKKYAGGKAGRNSFRKYVFETIDTH